MEKQEIVVHIKDEQMLNEAREILEGAGEKINRIPQMFQLEEDKSLNKLHFSNDGWWLARNVCNHPEITLSQLKDLLNNKL